MISTFQSSANPPLEQIIENCQEIEQYRTKHKKSFIHLFKERTKSNSDSTKDLVIRKQSLYFETVVEERPIFTNQQPKFSLHRLTRLYSLERKSKRDPSLAAKYKHTINEQINTGHAKKLTEKESKTAISITSYIKPAVLKPRLIIQELWNKK